MQALCPAAPSPANPAEAGVRAWLSGLGLEELTSQFVSKEYTDVELMKKIGVDDDDLDLIGITDPTQRAILQGKAAPV